MRPVEQVEQNAQHERRHFFGQAKVVAGLTLLSRVLGLIRDMLMIPLGGPVLADRFWTAFAIPNLFRRLFGEGALSAAFVPVFTAVGEREGWQRARQVLANVAAVLATVLVGIFLLVELGLWLAWVILPGRAPRLLLLQLTGLMLPFMVTVCLLALGSAALQCKGHFIYPAAAPIILNVCLITAAGWLARVLADSDARRFFILAAAVVFAGLAQLAGVLWLLKRVRLSVRLKLRPLLPETREIGKLMLPMLIPLSILQFSALADRLIALCFTASPVHPNFPLQAGVVRCLYAAGRLYQLPMGVLAISLATAIFPLFSRYAARGETAALRQTLNRALRLGAFLAIPAGTALVLLARQIVMLLFQRGRFDAFHTERTALVLQMYSLGMCGYFWNHVLLRAFFSIKRTRPPLVVATVLAGVNLVLVLGGIFTPLKAGAIGLATACTSTANALILIAMLRRRWGKLGFRAIVASISRTVLATVCMAAAVMLVLRYLPASLEPFTTAKGRTALAVLASVVGGTAVFFAAARLLRCPELRDLLGRGGPSPQQSDKR